MGGGKRLLLLVLWPVLVFAQEELDSYGPQPKQAEAARKIYEKQLAKYRDNKDKLVLPGLVADRQARTVEVLAEATGLGANEIIEFLLVDRQSAHGYEALLWSYAKPSDVHRALEFIGLKPGSPVNPAAGQFWSDGDPVAITVQPEQGKPVPIEQLILNTDTGKTLPEEGFVFAGSMTLPAEGDKPARYAADVYQPRSIASIYNEPGVVLDVPRQVNQSEVYGRQVVNPEFVLEVGKLLTVVLRPGAAAGKRRARQIQLAVQQDPGATGLKFRLTDAGKVLWEDTDITPVLEKLIAWKQDGGVAYVTLSFDNAVRAGDVGKTCVLMAMLESLGAVRMNPPPAGQLNWRAFVPSRDWLTPEGRTVQPWELHLAKSNETVVAALVRYEPKETERRTTFQRLAAAVTSPAAMQERLEAENRERRQREQSPLPPVLLVYTSPGMTYGELMNYIGPVLPTHRTVYVFVEEK